MEELKVLVYLVDFPFICAYLEELIRLIIARDGVKARPVLRLTGDGDGHA